MKLTVIDRITEKEIEEKVYGGAAIKALYTNPFLAPLKTLICRFSWFSALYGAWQKTSFSKGKILPFICDYGVDTSEFLDPVESFRSFNDFFIRKLKPTCRPIVKDIDKACMPADARYLFFQDISETDGFIVKGQKFQLKDLLQNEPLAEKYSHASMLIARLCPFDYHRFHFPVSGIPTKPRLINGSYYSVNPLALRKNIHILTENKRVLFEIESESFGRVLFIAIGATNVGSIQMTYRPGHMMNSGDEVGYFSFGGSSLVIVFPPGSIQFDQDLLAATAKGMEMRCLLGQSLGHCK